ncbi:MAG: hypothetical protein ACYTHM_04960, partial [Planctomycetota bacterium]
MPPPHHCRIFPWIAALLIVSFPVSTGSAASDGYTFDVAVDGKTEKVCVVNGTGFVLFARDAKADLQRAGGLLTPGYARNLCLGDGLAYVAG